MKNLLISLIVGAVAGAVTATVILYYQAPEVTEDTVKTQEELIAEFYEVENAVHVSPHHVRKHIGDGEVTLVDLRSQEEYETAHIIGAINIPVYATPDKSDYDSVDRIVNSFKELPQNTDIVVYCYSAPCMTGRKIGLMLADNGVYVQHLGIGWSEWKYYWNMWNHDGETAVNPDDYIFSGSEPGIFEGEATSGCSIGGELDC
ncbi:MAG: rhodanese-like domain-containing protein [bacterium]|nr:rhodanese-like domain-containing protein [bacterium]